MNFRNKDVFGYFRMGLVTGIVDKRSVVEWADNEIVRNPIPGHEVIELSLSSNRPYSQIIWLLSSFEGEPDYDLPLKLLLARAGVLLDQDPSRASAIIMGLRLLIEEEHLSKDVKSQLADLKSYLDMYKQTNISFEDLTTRLSSFLDRYADYRPQLNQIAQL